MVLWYVKEGDAFACLGVERRVRLKGTLNSIE
jgi:hypothetical protein